MVAIARALLNDNRVLLVDEPTKGLAPLLVAEVARVLERRVRADDGPARRAEPRRRRAGSRATPSCSTGPRRAHRPRAGAARRQPRARRMTAARMIGRRGDAMSTFVLLTITGLGLGAMYFLIASGLSLIYGLMGVLNFAHGAFITVGAYAFWCTRDEARRRLSIWPRFLLAALVGARRRRRLRGARRARADPAALRAPHRAGARHRRPRARDRRARDRRSGATTRSVIAVPQWLDETTDGRSARTSRTTAGSRSRPRCVVLVRPRGSS